MIHGFPAEDIVVDRIRGSGPGGQGINKRSTCVRITHKPSGVVVIARARSQHLNLATALAELRKRLKSLGDSRRASKKKQRRDEAIRDEIVIRTYDYKANRVKDHRTGVTGSIKDVIDKGELDAFLDAELRFFSTQS